jgi:hypothetical protein
LVTWVALLAVGGVLCFGAVKFHLWLANREAERQAKLTPEERTDEYDDRQL